MPAFVTHELFGTQVFGQLDEEIQEMLEMNPAPYFWGLQGPDLLFFRDAFFGRSVLQRYGGLMHCEKTDELFWAMSSYLNERKDTDEYETLAAYILGFVGHYCLDREAHPYVYFKQVQKERVLAADQRRGIHNRIESDIDTAFYRMKRGRSVQEYRPAKRLWGSPWEYRVIARLYQFLLEEVYGLQTDPAEVEKCFDDARRMVQLRWTVTGAWCAWFRLRRRWPTAPTSFRRTSAAVRSGRTSSTWTGSRGTTWPRRKSRTPAASRRFSTRRRYRRRT